MKTKEIILEKSLELFATKGYFNTTMDDIAKAVKIKKASLYFHYPGKDDIFIVVFNSILEGYSAFLSEMTRYDDETDTFEELCRLFRLYVINCKDNMKMEFWDRYYYYPPERFREQIHEKTYEIEMGFIGKIKELMEAGIRKKELEKLDAESAAVSFYYMMIGLALGVKFYTAERIEQEISKCLDMLKTALKA